MVGIKRHKCITCGEPCMNKQCRDCFTSNTNPGNKAVMHYKSPILKHCRVCGKSFYGYGKLNANYCSSYCRNYYRNHILTAKRDWERRNIKVRQLKNFGYFINRLEG